MTTPATPRAKLTRKTIRLFYLLSPVVFGAIALAILRIRGVSLHDTFRGPAPLGEQLLVGALAGAVAGLVVGIVVNRAQGLATLRGMIRDGFESADPKWFDLFLTSLSAGFSEELLFRGTLQPWLGIWLTSLLFMLAHGGGMKRSRGSLLFGMFVFGASLYLGVIYAHFGLPASMMTHFALDFVALLHYRLMVARTPAVQAVGS